MMSLALSTYIIIPFVPWVDLSQKKDAKHNLCFFFGCGRSRTSNVWYVTRGNHLKNIFLLHSFRFSLCSHLRKIEGSRECDLGVFGFVIVESFVKAMWIFCFKISGAMVCSIWIFGGPPKTHMVVDLHIESNCGVIWQGDLNLCLLNRRAELTAE